MSDLPSSTNRTDRTIIQTDQAPAAIGPYSQAVVFGGLVFTSGQIPLTPEGTLCGEDITSQAQQVFANLRAVLQSAESDLDNIVKMTIFLADMQDFATVNEICEQHLKEPYPARSTVQAAGLPKNVRIEIEAVAIVST